MSDMADETIVDLSEAAAQHIRDFLKDQTDLPPLRLSVVRTHCMGGRGHAYDLRVAEDRREEDVVAESRGVRFLVDPGSASLLRGIRLDFVRTEMGSSFSLENPNAVGKCHCGRHDLFP